MSVLDTQTLKILLKHPTSQYTNVFSRSSSTDAGIYTTPKKHIQELKQTITWFPPSLESPEIWKESQKVLKFYQNFGKVLEFFHSQIVQERFLSKHQHFSGFFCMLNLAVPWLTAVIFIWGILGAIMSIYTQHVTGWQYSNLPSRV